MVSVLISEIRTLTVDDILHPQQELPGELRARRVLPVWFAIEHLRVQAIPPFPFAIGDGLYAIVWNSRKWPGGVALVVHGQKFVPHAAWSAVMADAKSQSVSTRHLGPRSHNVALWTYLDTIPWLVL
jgi:hypothetical protein